MLVERETTAPEKFQIFITLLFKPAPTVLLIFLSDDAFLLHWQSLTVAHGPPCPLL